MRCSVARPGVQPCLATNTTDWTRENQLNVSVMSTNRCETSCTNRAGVLHWAMFQKNCCSVATIVAKSRIDGCGNEKLARPVLCGVFYTGQFFVQFASQQNLIARQVARNVAWCNAAHKLIQFTLYSRRN